MNKFKFIIIVFLLFILFSLGACGKKKTVEPEMIDIQVEEKDFFVGDSIGFTCNVYPADASQSVTITSSDPAITSVEGNALVSHKAGTVTITAVSNSNKDVYYSFDITTIIKAATSLELSADKYVIYIDETAELSSIVSPSYVSQEVNYTWTDNKEVKDVIKIEGNTVTGLDIGKAYVTATTKEYPYLSKTVTIEVKHVLLEISDSHAECIVGAPGEDASTEFNIHYMVKNTSSYALVAESSDTEFTNATAYYGSGEYYYDTDPALAGAFLPRNIWHITLTGLKSNTSYIYKIVNGDDTTSDVYHFTTAGGDSTSFLFLTDNHYYTASDGTIKTAGVSEESIKQALLIDPNIRFVLGGGDRIDTGGNDNIWKLYFEVAGSLKTLPYIDCPGNHEYYINQTGQRDNTYYAVYNAATRNGPGDLNGSSSWFIYNDILFILIDNNKNISYEEQMAWIADLLENKEYKYSIAVQHAPTLSADNSYYEARLIDLFDKYHVTFSLSGHTHSQQILKNYYNGQESTIEGLGTTYFRGSYSGVKSTTADGAIDNANAYIFNISGNTVTIKRIHPNGQIVSTWTYNIPTEYEIKSATKDELINSIKMTTDENNNQVVFNWSNNFYGNVNKVTVEEVRFNKLSNYAVIPTPAYTSVSLNDLIEGYYYQFNVNVEFTDGSSQDLLFEWNRGLDLGLSVEAYDTLAFLNITPLEEKYKYLVDRFQIFIKPKTEETYEGVGMWTYLDGFKVNSQYMLEDLTANTSYDIMLSAINYQGEVIFIYTSEFTTTE